MEPKIYMLDAITPDTKNWTAKVSVVNKTEPRTSSQPASIRFQKMLLADTKGNRIEAMLYRGDIDLLKNSLQPHQIYLISNAVVRPLKPALISTAAIIIDSHPPRTITARGKQNTLREYAAIDDLLRPFIITFWNDTAPDDIYDLLDQLKDRHIIAALNFNVTEYHNISLSSTSASVVLLNSKNERVQALQQWYFMHRREIDDIQHQGDVFAIAQSSFSIDPETFTSIQTFLTAEQDRSFMYVRAKLLSQIQNPIYACCTKCHRLTTTEYDCPFECHSCHETRTAIPRYRLSLLIYDQTGEMEVTAFGDDGEKIMRMSAADFLDKYCNAMLPTLDSINSNLQQLQLKMKVHSKVFNKQDGTSILSHTIQSVECHQLPSSTINTDEIPAALPLEYQICCSLRTAAGRDLSTATNRHKTSHIINERSSNEEPVFSTTKLAYGYFFRATAKRTEGLGRRKGSRTAFLLQWCGHGNRALVLLIGKEESSPCTWQHSKSRYS
ncbi:hypothetical protein OROMI_006817 [Orobanche minor]